MPNIDYAKKELENEKLTVTIESSVTYKKTVSVSFTKESDLFEIVEKFYDKLAGLSGPLDVLDMKKDEDGN